MTNVTTNDSILGPLTDFIVEYIFDPQILTPETLPEAIVGPQTYFGVAFLMSPKMNYVTRTIYNLFDLVKDVGGLASGQNGLFLIIMSILQY